MSEDLRFHGALPMGDMSGAILKARELGRHELADELTALRDLWARAVARACKPLAHRRATQRERLARESGLSRRRAREVAHG